MLFFEAKLIYFFVFGVVELDARRPAAVQRQSDGNQLGEYTP